MIRNILLLSILLICSTAAAAQGFSPSPQPTPPVRSFDQLTDADTFTSDDGGFSIGLPGKPGEYTRVFKDSVDFSSWIYTWYFQHASISILYTVNHNKRPLTDEDREQGLVGAREGVTHRGRLHILSECRFRLGKFRGAQYDVYVEYGRSSVARTLIGDSQSISISGIFSPSPSGTASNVIRRMDTLSIKGETGEFDVEAVNSMPQSPEALRNGMDSYDQGIKGNVRTVLEELEDAAENGARRTIQKLYFDLGGNLDRAITYDYDSLPNNVESYGYIQSQRVKAVRKVWEPSPTVPKTVPLRMRAADPRYLERYTYKYDQLGRLSERSTFNNAGRLLNRVIYVYSDRTLVVSTSGNDGQIWFKNFITFDEKGNTATDSLKYMPGYEFMNKDFTYKYVKFDDHGNWTERIKMPAVKAYGHDDVEYRTITYYK